MDNLGISGSGSACLEVAIKMLAIAQYESSGEVGSLSHTKLGTCMACGVLLGVYEFWTRSYLDDLVSVVHCTSR